MSSTFGVRYHENHAQERKRIDAERQQRNMLRIAKMRGKHAFWENIEVNTLCMHACMHITVHMHTLKLALDVYLHIQ